MSGIDAKVQRRASEARSVKSFKLSTGPPSEHKIEFNTEPENVKLEETIDPRISNFSRRSITDWASNAEKYNKKNIQLFEPGLTLIDKRTVGDDLDILSRSPSYSKFVIPFEVISSQRCRDSRRRYEKQFKHEINQLIDYQSSAREATYFVRLVSYTTFWPPLHNRHELNYVSENFFQLTPQEKWRLQYIMNNEFN